MNLMPFTADRLPAGCLVLRIFSPFVQIENESKTLPANPVRQVQLLF